jgi:hypothetical protein
MNKKPAVIDELDNEELTLPVMSREMLERDKQRVEQNKRLMPDLGIGYTYTWRRVDGNIYVNL